MFRLNRSERRYTLRQWCVVLCSGLRSGEQLTSAHQESRVIRQKQNRWLNSLIWTSFCCSFSDWTNRHGLGTQLRGNVWNYWRCGHMTSIWFTWMKGGWNTDAGLWNAESVILTRFSVRITRADYATCLMGPSSLVGSTEHLSTDCCTEKRWHLNLTAKNKQSVNTDCNYKRTQTQQLGTQRRPSFIVAGLVKRRKQQSWSTVWSGTETGRLRKQEVPELVTMTAFPLVPDPAHRSENR